MSERETRDFMSVDSFSQLPFIRPSPATDKPPTSTTAIRLFGIEVPHEPDAQQESSKDHTGTNRSGGGGESGRKFECHYCCRNFPTSQALGGHQNAHKRERQHAKRAHLQSAMVAHHQSAAIAGGNHMYGLLNYQRLGFSSEPSLPSHYPSWTSSINRGAQFYGGLGSLSQPINGSPLPGLWRVAPAAMHGGSSSVMMHHDRAMALPLFGGDTSRVGRGVAAAASSPSPQNRLLCESMPSVKDNVSLDLHL